MHYICAECEAPIFSWVGSSKLDPNVSLYAISQYNSEDGYVSNTHRNHIPQRQIVSATNTR